MNLNVKVEGPETWQWVTGKDPSCGSNNAQATQLSQHTALENLSCGIVR